MRKYFSKKWMAFMLAVMMVLSSGVTVFAESEAVNEKEAAIIDISELSTLVLPEAPETKPAVMLNGEYVAFSDAAPANINGRVMVPFRAILEAMGAAVEYDTESKEISAVLGEKEISFYAGKSELVITEGEKTDTVEMDVLPFIDGYTKRTYVSSRFVAEAFGYSVAWDHANKTVVIIDFEPIVKEAAEKFSILGLMFDNQNMDMTVPYKTTGDLAMDITIGADAMKALTGKNDAKALEFGIDGKFDGISQGMTAEMEMAVEIDLEDLMNALELAGTADGEILKTVLSNLSMEIKMDEENIYLNMPMLDYFIDSTGGKTASGTPAQETWYKMPLETVFSVYEAMGIDLAAMISEIETAEDFEGFLRLMVHLCESEMTIDTYYTIQVLGAVLNEVMGDSAFTTRTSGSTKIHTMVFDAAAISEIAGVLGEEEAAKELLDAFKEEGVDFGLSLTIRERNDALVDFTMDFYIEADGIGALTVKESGDLYNAKVEVSIAASDWFEILINTTEKITKTSTKPDLTIPEDAVIVDMAEEGMI